MLVYRITEQRFARDLSGEGARLFGGRWNQKGVPCLYTSGSRALALVEFSVNVIADQFPRTLSMTTIEVPEKKIFHVDPAELPEGWKSIPAPASVTAMGTRWLLAKEFPVIRVPSVIFEEEFNYLLNPVHPSSKLFKVVSVKQFPVDPRWF